MRRGSSNSKSSAIAFVDTDLRRGLQASSRRQKVTRRANECALAFVEQVETPIDRSPQRRLARQRLRSPPLENAKAFVEPLRQLLWRENFDPCCGEFNRQGKAVQPAGRCPKRSCPFSSAST